MTITHHNEIMADVRRLESLSQVILRVLELINDSRTTPQQLADAIALDPSLTARVLALASSVFFGAARHSTSLREALVRLGFNVIKSLVVTASVAPSLNGPLPGYTLDRGQLWGHSIACGICARMIAARINYPHREEAYIAGLLHDIGKVIIDRHVRNEFVRVLELSQQQQIPFVDAERMVIGFDHAQIGQIVMEHWKLSPTLAEAVGYHHSPLRSSGTTLLPLIVHVADAITYMVDRGATGESATCAADFRVVQQLGLNVESIEELMVQLGDSLRHADAFMKI